MILVLSPEQTAAGEGFTAHEDIRFRTSGSIDEILGWLADESFERILIPLKTDENPNGLNPFALARSLRGRGPEVILFGDLRPHLRYWAERNGCGVSADLKTALEKS